MASYSVSEADANGSKDISSTASCLLLENPVLTSSLGLHPIEIEVLL